jgi:hypothetical protein
MNKFKRGLSLLLTVALLLFCLPQLPLVAATATTASGKRGDNLTWTEDVMQNYGGKNTGTVLESPAEVALEASLAEVKVGDFFTVEAVRCGEITVSCKSKTRTILVPGKLKNLLLNYAKRRKIAAGAIFVTRTGRPLNRSNIWAAMKKLCHAADVKSSKVFPHNLRKLFARTFYGIEKDIAKLADILGHSSINTTRIYIMTTGAEHRRKIERLGLVVW